MFIDETNIHVKAGDGGNGAVAFLRLKYMPWGGPAGGDGGKGGDVVFEATHNIDTLLPLYRKRRIAAQDGKNGSSKNCSGAIYGSLPQSPVDMCTVASHGSRYTVDAP